MTTIQITEDRIFKAPNYYVETDLSDNESKDLERLKTEITAIAWNIDTKGPDYIEYLEENYGKKVASILVRESGPIIKEARGGGEIKEQIFECNVCSIEKPESELDDGMICNDPICQSLKNIGGFD